MPVRQERIISLINAAVEYRSLVALARKWLRQPQLEHMTRDELLGQIQMWASQLEYAMVENAANHDATITMEYHNLRSNRGRNERAKEKMREKRRNAGLIPRAQPKNLNEAHTLVVRDDIIDPPMSNEGAILPTRQHTPAWTDEDEAELERQYNEAKAARDAARAEQDEEAAQFHDKSGKPKPLFQSSGTNDEYLEHLDETESDMPE